MNMRDAQVLMTLLLKQAIGARREQRKERGGRLTRSSASTTSNAAMRRDSPYPEGLWRHDRHSCVVPPRRSAATTPSSSRLGLTVMARTTLIQKECHQNLRLACRYGATKQDIQSVMRSPAQFF